MHGHAAQHEERRHQGRVSLNLATTRARRWSAGAWRDLTATVIDLSSRGVGLRLDQPVQLGDRVSLQIPLGDGGQDLRVTVEIRHGRKDTASAGWLAGGLFRMLAAGDFERISQFVAAEL
jgi:hypothetical protein